MRRLFLATVSVVAGALALPAAPGAQTPAQDSAVGSGATSSTYQGFDFTATSDPVGGSPRGAASWDAFGFHFEGTVSCLAVSGNRAVIGIDIDASASTFDVFEGFFLTAIDGGPAGSGLDIFDAVPTIAAGGENIVPNGLLGAVSDLLARSGGRGRHCRWRSSTVSDLEGPVQERWLANFPQFQNQLQCNLFVDRTCGERGRFEPRPKQCPVRLP